MKKTQIGFGLVNAPPHLGQLRAHLQNVLYRHGALQNCQILRFLGASVAQARFLVHVLARSVTRFNGVLLHCFGDPSHLCSRLIEVFGGNAHRNLGRPCPLVAAAYPGTHDKSGEMRCEVAHLFSRLHGINDDDVERPCTNYHPLGVFQWRSWL